jgi:hypothetical protein
MWIPTWQEKWKWHRRRTAAERNALPYDAHVVRAGDIVDFWENRPEHYATIHVLKVNRSRFTGVEIDGGLPNDRRVEVGKMWHINRLATHLRRTPNALELLKRLGLE